VAESNRNTAHAVLGGVIAVNILGSLERNHFVFTVTIFKVIVLNDVVGFHVLRSGFTKNDGFTVGVTVIRVGSGATAGRDPRGHVGKVIVMNPQVMG